MNCTRCGGTGKVTNTKSEPDIATGVAMGAALGIGYFASTNDMGRRTLFIDGEEFPWSMDAAGPILANREDGICTVTLTFLVDAIEVLPIPARSEAECLAELHVAAAQQDLVRAQEGGDPLEIQDAQMRLRDAHARLNGH